MAEGTVCPEIAAEHARTRTVKDRTRIRDDLSAFMSPVQRHVRTEIHKAVVHAELKREAIEVQPVYISNRARKKNPEDNGRRARKSRNSAARRIPGFGACSAFTSITACMIAKSPSRPSTPKAPADSSPLGVTVAVIPAAPSAFCRSVAYVPIDSPGLTIGALMVAETLPHWAP